MRYVLTIVIFCMAPTMPCYAGWIKSDIGFAFSEQLKVMIGNGRNDGVLRVYSGDEGGNISEFSFSTDHWETGSFDANVTTAYGLDIGSSRNDGIKRIYATGYNLAEYSYDFGSWSGGQIGPYIQWTNDIVLGNARNDGKVRVYVAEWDGILELTYNNGSWDQTAINTGGQSMGRLLITDGRNDSVLRLYASTDSSDHVFEYTWTGSAWQVADCGAGTSGTSKFYDMVVGNGRNDGKNRFYLAAHESIYELSYTGTSWQYTIVASPAPAGFIATVSVGPGRNDGENRVYAEPCMLSGCSLVEYSYDGTWAKTSDLDSGFAVNDIAIGKGRNDGINRVYMAGDDYHIYEYSSDAIPPSSSYLLWTK